MINKLIYQIEIKPTKTLNIIRLDSAIYNIIYQILAYIVLFNQITIYEEKFNCWDSKLKDK